MKEDDQAVVAPMITNQPVMGHHQHQQQQQQQHHPINHHHSHSHSHKAAAAGMELSTAAPHEPAASPTYPDSAGLLPHQNTNNSSNNQQYVPVHQLKELEDECLTLRETTQKMKQQLIDSQRRERLMVRRLAAKEQELLDYVNQVAELKSVQTPGQSALKTAVLDPAVNVLFQKLKLELQTTQARLEETQNELAAWKFTPDSNTGKRLMAKCRLLHQENEELGKLTSNGRLAKLESELALQKVVSEDLKKSHCDLDEVLLELEEDVEGMQNTILLMQRELKVEKGENVRMLAVLRDKPEWLAAVQATRAEAASVEERLKQEQKKATEHRLNGGGGGGVNETQMEDSTTTTTLEVKAQGLRTQPSNSAGVTVSVLGGEASVADRTAESGASVVVVVSVEHATNGKPMDVVSNNNNNNNGQTTTTASMMTRKRTRSSVASSVVGGGGGGVGVGSVEDEEMMLEEENEVAKLCGGGSLKRNRYSVVNSDKSGAALVVVVPRTRGQLQLAEAEKKLEVMEEGEEEPVEVTENGGGGGGVAGEAITELQRDVGDRDHSDPLRLSKGGVVGVLFSNNNNNNGNNKLCATPEEEEEEEMENGRRAGVAAETSTEAIKCKLENGSSGGGIELNNV